MVETDQTNQSSAQTLGGWLWPPEAISQLGPVHALLLKVVTLESVGGAVAAFSMKVR